MERKRPVRICEARQTPRREPKFHQAVIFAGAGRSTRRSLATFSRG